MEKSKLDNELEFVRKQIQIFKERANELEAGNWRKNISSDFDKCALWAHYRSVISDLEYLLKIRYDAK